MTINEVTVTSFREQVEIYFPTLDSFLWLTCLTAQDEPYLLYSLVKRLLTPWTDFTLSSFKVHCLYVADPTLHFALNSAMCLWMIKNVMSTTAAYPVGGSHSLQGCVKQNNISQQLHTTAHRSSAGVGVLRGLQHWNEYYDNKEAHLWRVQSKICASV